MDQSTKAEGAAGASESEERVAVADLLGNDDGVDSDSSDGEGNDEGNVGGGGGKDSGAVTSAGAEDAGTAAAAAAAGANPRVPKARKLSQEELRVHRTTLLIREQFGGEAYSSRFYEVVWAKNSAREPFWPAVLWDPIKVRGKPFNEWIKKTTGKKNPGEYFIVLWLGYNSSYSVLAKNAICGWQEGNDEGYNVNGGKKSLSKKMTHLFENALESAKSLLDTLVAERYSVAYLGRASGVHS